MQNITYSDTENLCLLLKIEGGRGAEQSRVQRRPARTTPVAARHLAYKKIRKLQ